MNHFGRLGLTVRAASRRWPLLGLVWGCSSSPTPPPDPGVAVGTRQVLVVDDAFEPPHNLVSEGDTVTWTWAGTSLHNVTFEDAQFSDSPTQRVGTHMVAFPVPGAFDYYCSVHGRNAMSGRVTVERGTQRPDPGDPAGRY
jgi:plastocyanin